MKPWFRLTPEQERLWKALERGEPVKLAPPRTNKAYIRGLMEAARDSTRSEEA